MRGLEESLNVGVHDVKFLNRVLKARTVLLELVMASRDKVQR
jgi:hypothetical protein